MTRPVIEPDELPERPLGWTRRLICHIRAGQPIGNSALFEVLNERGEQVKGILYGHRTGAESAGRGFVISGEEGGPFRPWSEFREHYKAHRARRAMAETANG